jgi:hypothetical protein
MKKLTFVLAFLLTSTAFAERIDTGRMAKRLKRITGVQIDMNVEKGDACVYWQMKSLYKTAKNFKRAQRKNLKVWLDHQFNKIVIHPTKTMGEMTGNMGMAYLKDQYMFWDMLTGENIRYKNVSQKVAWDNRVYKGEENVNSWEDAEGTLNLFVAKADMRYTEHSYVVLRKRIVKENNQLRSVTNPNWSESFVKVTDEMSALEASDMDKKVQKGGVKCGKKLTWYDFGYDAQYLF